MRFFIAVGTWFLVVGMINAQPLPIDTLPPPDTLKIPDTVVVKDTTLHADTILFVPSPDTSALSQLTSPIDLEQELTQPPTLGLFKSLLLPGWGQVGNGKYVKAGIFVGLQGWFMFEAIHYGRQANDFKNQFNAAESNSARNALYSLYQDRRSERNKYLWFFGITKFISMFDAYVDAHLSGSPTERRNRAVSFDVAPDSRGGAQARLTLAFH